MYFIGFCALIAGIGFIATVKMLRDYGYGAETIILRALDLFAIAVPPILPAAMTIGTAYSLSRLKV